MGGVIARATWDDCEECQYYDPETGDCEQYTRTGTYSATYDPIQEAFVCVYFEKRENADAGD